MESNNPSISQKEEATSHESGSSPKHDNDEPSVITDSLSMHTAKRLKVEARKLDGMQRELYNLIGENQPPVVVTQSNKFKSRPEWQQKATPWALAEFEPKKGLKLKHWVRAASIADGTSGDRFARFNTKVQVPKWTDEDYEFFPKTGISTPEETKPQEEVKQDATENSENKNAEEKQSSSTEKTEETSDDKKADDSSKEKSEGAEKEQKEPNSNNNDTESKEKDVEKGDTPSNKDSEKAGEKNNEDVEPETPFTEWTLEESRYLFDLVEEYDIRWPVIADRYNYPGTNRSVDDLKERYYDICRALIKNKPVVKEMGLSPHDEEYLESIKFSKSNELKRKAHLERLLTRNPGDVAEEEALILEARRIESISARIAEEREDLLKVLESPMTLNHKIKHELSSSHGVGQLLQELQSEKSRKSNVSNANSVNRISQIVSKAINRNLTEREITAYGITYTEATKVKHSGVYVRSAKITPIRQNLLLKVKAVLTELGLPLKPVMPTAKMCAHYETLYQLINVLLEAKKVQDKLEMEIDVLKKTKEKLSGSNETDADNAMNDAP